MSSHLLMIEDDARLAEMVGEYLGQSGLHVTHRADGAQRPGAQLQGPEAGPLPDLVILDLMLPDMDGLEVCRRIRALQGPAAQVPVLMLTAKGDPMDRIIGLEMGADDYLPKPFEPRELLARIRAILRRRTDGGSPPPHPRCALARWRSTATRAPSPWRAGGRSHLLPVRPAGGTLAERAGRVLTRDQIMEAVRGRELEAFDRSIDVHMGRIRAAIEARRQEPAPHPHGARRGLCVCQAAAVM
jgi:two-component system phosphate regulon response regulator OmpR